VIVRVIIRAAIEVASRVKVTDQAGAGASSDAFEALSIAASASYSSSSYSSHQDLLREASPQG
jgi:hypothetical protein